jgi:hypothetical protein
VTFLQKHRELCLVLAAFAAAVAAILAVSIRLAGGSFIYPLDDAYIHLAIARNFIEHGVWGITRHEFTSSTSSPLWTGLEALGFLAPRFAALFPLALGIALALLLIATAHAFLRRAGLSGGALLATLLLAVFAAPLPTLAVLGMEHVLHALLTTVFAWVCAKSLPGSGRAPWRLLLLAALLTATRYEGLFLVAAACVLFAFRRRFAAAAALALAAWAPPVAYGLWSLSNGWHFFPNSLLLKASLPRSSFLSMAKALSGFNVLRHAVLHPHILALLVASALLCASLYRRGRLGSFAGIINVLFLASAVLHLNFASLGWLFRYEAYLVFLGILAVAAAVRERGAPILPEGPDAAMRRAFALAVLALAMLPFGLRAFESLRTTPMASRNIHEQPWQTALFLREHFPGKTVLVNDIGAVAYLTDARILDLWGLGSLHSANLKRARLFGPDSIEAWARREGAEIAVVSDVWFEPTGGLPESWRRVGQWRISDNVICGSEWLSVYAVEGDADRIADQARRFSRGIPRVQAAFPAGS